jgi:hypothetical protein
MFANTGSLSFYLGIIFIVLALVGFLITIWQVKKSSIAESKLDKLIELGKWFIVSVAIVVGSSIIGDGFKERDQDVKEVEVFDKYVSTITEADGIEKRWLLAEYFSVVAPDGEFRKSWGSYKEILKPKLDEYRANKVQITTLAAKAEPTEAEKQQIAKLQETNEVYEQSLVTTSNSESARNPEEWLIIAGGDATIEAAQDELNKAKKISSEARIYKKGNMYRTVIPNFFSRTEAINRLPDVKRDVNSGAYVVTLNNWCRNVQDNGAYLSCN